MSLQRLSFACLYTWVLVLVAAPVRALEIHGGVSVGGILIGSEPRLAVTPHASLSWRLMSGLALSVHDQVNILPAANKIGVGVYNHTSVTLGYAWDAGSLSIGPALSIYSVPVCSASLCGRVVGVGPGGFAQVLVYVSGPLGVSVSANLDWLGGASLVLPDNVAATVLAGPVFRWGLR